MKNTGRSISKKNNSSKKFTIEHLENRTLLSANAIDIDWHALEHSVTDQNSPEGYGHADPIFSDPSTWDPAYLADVLESQNDQNTTTGGCSICVGCGRCSGSMTSTSTTTDASSLDQQASQQTSEYLDAALSTSAEYTLYLNFDAARVYSRAGDFWLNRSYVDVPGYDLSMYGWGGYESQSIEYIVNFVQEDYAAYDVNVVTTEPTSGSYTTIYVGGTSDWYIENGNVIGVATYDIGNRDDSNYGFAFTEELSIYKSYAGNSLLNFSEYVANLISHEAGHTFGANHVDDTDFLMNPYLSANTRTVGFGNGQISGYSSTQDTQELFGSNIGYANNTADDNTGITDININTTTSISGLLEHVSDTDAFRFEATASGTFTVDLSTDVYSNLNSTLTIYDSNDNIIASNDDYYSSEDSYVSFTALYGEAYTIVVGSSDETSSGSYSLDLTAPEGTPEITVTDNSGNNNDLTIDFGDIYVGDSETYSVKIRNDGSETLTINNIITSGNFDITLPNNKSGDISIDAGGTATIVIAFNPETANIENGQITIYSNDTTNSAVTINITGQAITPTAEIEVSEVDSYGSIYLGSTAIDSDGIGYITINNTGDKTLDISSIILTGGFITDTDSMSIEAGESQVLAVSYSGSNAEIMEGTITITSNDSDQEVVTYTLSSEILGTEYTSNISNLTIVEADGIDDGIIYGGELSIDGEHQVDLWYITNNGFEDITINLNDSADAEFVVDGEIVIPAGETITISSTFSSTSPYRYSEEISLSSDDISLTVPVTVTVDTYAEFGGINRYSFKDHDGDTVTLTLLNGSGKIFLGDDSSSDINKIEIEQTSRRASALIISTGFGGTTEVAGITADGDFSMINASGVDITGEVNIAGEVNMLRVHNINQNAEVNYSTGNTGGILMFNDSEGDITISGMLRMLNASGSVKGSVTTDGDLTMLRAAGDISAEINIDGNARIIMADEISGSNINIDGNLGLMSTSELNDSEVYSSGDIGTALIRNDMVDSRVSAGFSPEFGSSTSGSKINAIMINGTYQNSTISSGISPDDDNSLMNGQATSSTGTINLVRIGSTITVSEDGSFGIIANGDIKTVIIGREIFRENLQDGDFEIIEYVE